MNLLVSNEIINAGPSPGPVRDLLEGVRSRNLAGRFGRDAAGTLALRVTFAVCYGVANIFLARILGAADYGSYTFAAAWLTLLGIPTVLGMDRFLVREVATYSVQGAWGQMRGLLRQSNAHVLALSVTTGSYGPGSAPSSMRRRRPARFFLSLNE